MNSNENGKPLSRFAKTVNGVSPTFDLLFGTHVCDLYDARGILEDGRLRASPCTKFIDEHLLYLFYGKPSFKPSTSLEGKRFSAHFPVCFVVRLDKQISWKRIFPFDSGAYPERFSAYFQRKMPLEDFVFPGECDSARRIVNAFFASNSDYYNVKPRTKIKCDKTLETETYHEFLRAFGIGHEMQGDDRLVAIEMQACGEIAANRGNIVQVILPDKALELEDVKAGIRKCRIPFDVYRTGELATHVCHAFISEMVRKLNGLGK